MYCQLINMKKFRTSLVVRLILELYFPRNKFPVLRCWPAPHFPLITDKSDSSYFSSLCSSHIDIFYFRETTNLCCVFFRPVFSGKVNTPPPRKKLLLFSPRSCRSVFKIFVRRSSFFQTPFKSWNSWNLWTTSIFSHVTGP